MNGVDSGAACCPLTTTLEIWPGLSTASTDRDWAPVVQGSIPTYAEWIDNGTLDPSNRVLKCQTTLDELATYTTTPAAYPTTTPLSAVYQMRWKTTDPISTAVEGTYYEAFNYTIKYACDGVTVVLDNDADDDSDRIVIDGSGAATIASAAVNANDFAAMSGDPWGITVCKWQATFWLYNEVTSEY